MTELTTATGRVIPCDSVVRGKQYPFLYIHTAELRYGEAGTVFDDPAETAVLTAVTRFSVSDDGSPVPASIQHVYRGYTEINSIQRSPLFDNPAELMIILQQPVEAEG